MTGRELKETLFFPGWRKALLLGVLTGVALKLVTGCSTPAVSEPAYPEYEKWWTEAPGPRKSKNLSDLGQGDILVFDNGSNGRFSSVFAPTR